MCNNRSPPLMRAETSSSLPVLAGGSPAETVSAALESHPREGIKRWPFAPLLYPLIVFFVASGSISAISQSESETQFSSGGSKLVGTFAVGPAFQGWSVALSADGNTAIVGGTVDNKLSGAAWVHTRSGNTWAQQSTKLTGTGAVGPAGQGVSVALSAAGDTAIVGGPYDNKGAGAAWVYIRGSGVWSQQGSKLVGSNVVGNAARQGFSVALSADGNTALVGAFGDSSYTGAAWVYTRDDGAWTPRAKLVGTGAIGQAAQGFSVALSADGNTAIVGGAGDNSYTGGAWVYAYKGGVWTQQAKLVGTGAVGQAGQGSSVALSADGNTAIVGGAGDNSFTGAAWIYTRAAGVWTQHGSKLVGDGAIGSARQGHSVGLSGDGKTAIVGGPHDTSYTGAAWVYTRGIAGWNQQGGKVVGAGALGSARQGSSVALSANGNTAVVGGIADDRLNGAAWVHTRSGTVWTEPPQSLGY
jgi:hypothetical protein